MRVMPEQRIDVGDFDPYHKWLGIPPGQRPPDHYQLLGIAHFESDPDVIANAADRQTTHIRSLRLGKHTHLCERLLNEISAARVCLLNARRKTEYDARLGADLAAREPGTIGDDHTDSATPSPREDWGTVDLVDREPPQPVSPFVRHVRGGMRRDTGRLLGGLSVPRDVLLAVFVGVMVVLLLATYLQFGRRESVDVTSPLERGDVGSQSHKEIATPPKRSDVPASADKQEPKSPSRPPLAVSPFEASRAQQLQQAWASYLGAPIEYTNSIGMKLVLIPAGEFPMGSPDSEVGRDTDEGPRQRVQITRPFYLGVHEVTQAKYQAVMGSNPSHFVGRTLPVESVSWDDATEYCRTLSVSENRTYRLPTEAEWEYACRAGATATYVFGDDPSKLGAYAWFDENADDRSHDVGQKHSNPFGLYDIHGNVFEWCADGGYARDDDATFPTADSTGPAGGDFRAVRGGGYDTPASGCRAANRVTINADDRFLNLGFRVALDVAEKVESPKGGK